MITLKEHKTKVITNKSNIKYGHLHFDFIGSLCKGKGFVYVAYLMKYGLVKIGYTKRLPTDRLNSLKTKYTEIAILDTEYCYQLEQYLHYVFSEYREGTTEFFKFNKQHFDFIRNIKSFNGTKVNVYIDYYDERYIEARRAARRAEIPYTGKEVVAVNIEIEDFIKKLKLINKQYPQDSKFVRKAHEKFLKNLNKSLSILNKDLHEVSYKEKFDDFSL